MLDDVTGSENTGLGKVVKELGGEERLYNGAWEDVMYAVVRVVDNTMGALPRHQIGRGVYREAIENILIMVPGFWRARMGLLVAALTKPGSVEGTLSLGVIARE